MRHKISVSRNLLSHDISIKYLLRDLTFKIVNVKDLFEIFGKFNGNNCLSFYDTLGLPLDLTK